MPTSKDAAEATTAAAADSKTAVDEHPAASPTPAHAEDLVAAQRKEYGQYVAAQQIYSGNALAYNPLDPVPAANVERHGYLDAGLVVKTGSKEHEQLRKQVLGL